MEIASVNESLPLLHVEPNTWYSDAKDWIDELTDAADGFYYGLLTGSTVGFIYVICSCFIVYKVWRKKVTKVYVVSAFVFSLLKV